MVGRKVIYVRYISCSCNNVAKGIGLLDKKAILVYTGKKFMQVRAFERYIPLSQQDFGCINDFRIDSFCEWSDYAPVLFNVLCNTEVFTPENTENGDPQIKWKDSLRDQFRRCLIARLADLNTVVNHIDVDDRTSVNSCVNRFSEILNGVSKPLFTRENICKQPHTSSAIQQ